MTVEVASLTERLRTVSATERLLLVVEALMCDEIAVANVALAALGTSVRLRASVNVQVTGQVASLDERLAADVASESLVFLKERKKRVRKHVTRLQLKQLNEIFEFRL